MSMSPVTAQESLGYFFTGAGIAARPAGWSVSLHTGDPGNTGTANEVSDSAYARQPATFALNTADAGFPLVANTASIAYANAATGYTATHVVVWDTTNNRPLVIQRLVTDKVVAAGSPAQFAAGELIIGGRN
jgi:hypothetical protein